MKIDPRVLAAMTEDERREVDELLHAESLRPAFTPRPWQAKVMRERKRFSVVCAHRRSGKSLLALHALLDGARQAKLPLAVFAYIGPFLRQVRSIVWQELKELVAPMQRAGLVEVLEAESSVRFTSNGATLRLLGSDNANALRGLRFDGVVLDEVSQQDAATWDSIVQPALADRGGWAIFIGTPQGQDLFYRLYCEAANRADWYRIVVPATATNAIPADELERMQREMPEMAYRREMLCDFSASAADQLLSIEEVEAAASRTILHRDVDFAARVLGVDPARFGDDRSVIVKRQGLCCFPPITLAGVSNMELAARVAHEVTSWGADAVFVDAGAGAGVIDRLRQLGHAVIEVPFGGVALRPQEFANRRTEMWCNLAAWLRGGGGVPRNADLMKELATPTFWYDAKQRKVLEPKDSIRKRLGGASCDHGDALALCFAAEVAPRHRYPDSLMHEKVRTYHPFSDERTRARMEQRSPRRGR